MRRSQTPATPGRKRKRTVRAGPQPSAARKRKSDAGAAGATVVAKALGNPAAPGKETRARRRDRTARGQVAGPLSGGRQTLRSGSAIERARASLRLERGLRGGSPAVGGPSAGRVFAAHQLRGKRRGQSVE